MGSVFEAIDVQTGQQVAIKALSPHLAQVEGFRDRFEAEIESLKTLRHDGIVRLFGYGEQDGVLFYSMEMIHGPSLEDELKAGRRFSWREVTDIAIQLCMALKHAHDHGVIHRDIKPANVLIADDERVKLADFGIARLFGTSSNLTTAGGVLGTADYMSPEQADGRPVTNRCDQYSLGGVMYALLASRPPFRAKSLPEMLQLQRFAEPEPVSRYADQTPKQLEQVIKQLLSKDPAERFPNTQVLARHLRAMGMALTRPTSDDFSIAEESPEARIARPDLRDSVSLAVTQSEPDAMPSISLAAVPSPQSVAPANEEQDSDATEADPAAQPQQAVLSRGIKLASAAASPVVPVGSATFTTVEEDAARRHRQQAHKWPIKFAQLLGLAVALTGLMSLAMYLSRPATADQLYDKITAQVDADDLESIRKVESEISEFIARFPDDERAAALREFEHQIELERTHRRLLIQARRGGSTNGGLLPVEVLYLEAMNAAAASPESAVEKLESLVVLFDAEISLDADSSDGKKVAASKRRREEEMRRIRCVQLARRQLESLRADIATLSAEQLASLRERITAADAIASDDLEQAREMYQAIIRLFGDKSWAESIVAEARAKLLQDKETGRKGDKESGGL
jgi:serine/threonine-protein kinase